MITNKIYRGRIQLKTGVNCLLAICCALLFALPLSSLAQDTIPKPPRVSGFRGPIGRLKGSLSKPNTDADNVASLLQTAKDLNYLPGQVVALCQLAFIHDETLSSQSKKELQDALALAGQIHEIPEAGWAMNAIGKIMTASSAKSADLRNGLSSVVSTLGQAIRNTPVKVPRRNQALAQAGAVDDDDDVDLKNLKLDKIIALGLKYEQHVKRYGDAKSDITDHLLDTLLGMTTGSQTAKRQLLIQKRNRDSTKALSNAFAKKGNYAEAYRNFLAYSSYKDSLTAEVSNRRLAALQYKQNLLKKEAEIKLLNKDRQIKEQAAARQWILMFSLFACIAALTVILLVLNRNNRLKKKTNAQLNLQKDELEKALAELKSTQTQLIQSEKMASLGELTAGIAHEIQNPLNFVNNFSEVSAELVHELLENQCMPELDKAQELELLTDVKNNLEKIAQHGKRASTIIRGMLEHSRSESGGKEPTDLDELVDEYLKLSYHGMRARDKTFEVKIITDLKVGADKINLVPQEIGRVLLNIFNNAFYAVHQREKVAQNGFQPTVTVHTHREKGQVIIKIKDNGAGMPDSVKQKIFQPFFTTKPTGEGTGLGLSLSYDMITKGHGGKLLVTSEVNNYTEFTVVLPV